MTELNEYQKKANAEAVEFHELLQPIVDQMPDPWSLDPVRLNDEGHARRCCFIVNTATGQQIMARYNEYDIRGKFEFKAVEWPKYTDENGRECTSSPDNCYQPREQAPSTKATAGRDPKAIASQIGSKIIPDYERIYERCQGLAAESQVYHDTTKQALDQLTEATGDDRHSIGRCRDQATHRGDAAGDRLAVAAAHRQKQDPQAILVLSGMRLHRYPGHRMDRD